MPVLLFLRAGALPLEVVHFNSKQRECLRHSSSSHRLQNMLNARISDTQRFSLVTIKYNGILIVMKYDAHEVNAKLSGRLGLGLA